ncbi:hypothetical protein [Streptomyces sp. NBC_00842]|nr:hypothetical protein OH821_01420 [Streptomyces sp. NBC_00842]WTA49122.1 hypothetical protein OH821_42390 [Streptomyces sp. NBC_00842]
MPVIAGLAAAVLAAFKLSDSRKAKGEEAGDQALTEALSGPADGAR